MVSANENAPAPISDIRLSCFTGPWGPEGLVPAITAIADTGFDGIECSAGVVHRFEDRLHVFEEILESAGLTLSGLLHRVDILDREGADEAVERAANAARFLQAAGRGTLTVFSGVTREDPMNDEEWATACAIIEEIGQRCNELEVPFCFLPRAMRLIGTEKEIKRLLASTDPAHVNLALDTAEIVLAGGKPKKMAKSYLDRLQLVRFRDASASKRRSKSTTDKPGSTPQFGRGAVEFEEVSQTLIAEGYTGWVSLDVSGDSHSPSEAIRTGYRYLLRKSGLLGSL